MARILVVDDDDSIRELIRLALTSVGFDVVAVESGERAVEVVSATLYDAAIVDLMMPGMDGMETIQALRTRAPGLPAVIMSGALMRADAGAPDFLRMASKLLDVTRLSKPFTLPELVRSVRGCIAVAA